MRKICKGTKCNEIAIDITEALAAVTKNLSIEDYFYLKDFQERKHYLTDEIYAGSVEDICKAILQYNKEDKDIDPEERQPVLLYLDTLGGDVTEGFRLIDVIQSSKTPVYIINLGTCYSMGFIIYAVGHKRFASKNATFLMHDGSMQASGSTSKTRDYMEFNDRLDARCKDIIVATTQISSELYDEQLRKEWYMFSDEAKELGLVDYILGVDCDIDDII